MMRGDCNLEHQLGSKCLVTQYVSFSPELGCVTSVLFYIPLWRHVERYKSSCMGVVRFELICMGKVGVLIIAIEKFPAGYRGY